MPTRLDTHNFMYMGELFHWSDRGFFHYRGPGWSRRCDTLQLALAEAAS